MRLTFVLFQMSQLRAGKRVCKERGTKAYYLAKSCNDVARRDWLYRDGAARKVLGDRDFVFGDELTRDNLLKIVVTADEPREAFSPPMAQNLPCTLTWRHAGFQI